RQRALRPAPPLEVPGRAGVDPILGAGRRRPGQPGGQGERGERPQLHPQPPPLVPRPPVEPSRLDKTWSSAAASCWLVSNRMVRSARCSFSLGRTACLPQPASAAASAAAAASLEKDRQSTAQLLSARGLVRIEEGPVAQVDPHRDLLLE